MKSREVTIRGQKPTLKHLEFMVDSMVPSHHRIINKWGDDHPEQKQLLRTGLSEPGLQVISKNVLRFLLLVPTIIFIVILLILAALPNSVFGTAGYIFALLGWIALYGLYIVAYAEYMKKLAFNSEVVVAYFTDWEYFVEVFANMGTLTTKSWKISDIQSITVFKQSTPSATQLIKKEQLSLEIQLATDQGVVNRQLFGSEVPVSLALHLPFYDLNLQKLGQVIGIKEENLHVVEDEAKISYIEEQY